MARMQKLDDYWEGVDDGLRNCQEDLETMTKPLLESLMEMDPVGKGELYLLGFRAGVSAGARLCIDLVSAEIMGFRARSSQTSGP